jgi:hypothetical protein
MPITLKLPEGQANDGKSASDIIKRGVWPNVKPIPNRKQKQGTQ